MIHKLISVALLLATASCAHQPILDGTYEICGPEGATGKDAEGAPICADKGYHVDGEWYHPDGDPEGGRHQPLDSFGWSVRLVDLCHKPYTTFIDENGEEHNCRSRDGKTWEMEPRPLSSPND